jgi:hypothetical protein
MGTSAIHQVHTTTDDVHLVIRASSDFLRTLRLVAADAAARAGLDLAEIEDFRIAVDELSYAVMTATDYHLQLTFRTEAGTVVARGSARRRGGGVAPTLTELSRTIVSGVCDWFELADERSEIVFAVVKRSRRAMVERA